MDALEDGITAEDILIFLETNAHCEAKRAAVSSMREKYLEATRPSTYHGHICAD